MKCTAHRIFLASLILAAKNLNDSSPKNKHWARYTTVRGFDSFGFSLTEVNLMEKQLLGLLDWDLRVTEDDLYFHLEPFLAPIRRWQAEEAERQRMQEMERQRQEMMAAEQRRTAMENARCYNSSRSYLDQYAYRSAYYPASSNGSSRAPSRTPSLSPPTRSQSSASYSSVDSYASTSSPASITSSYTEPICEEIPVHIQQYDSYHLPPIVSVPPPMPTQSLPMLHGHPHGLPLDQTDHHPAKKMKSSSNFFSKFLPTTLTRPVY
jgi:hypothetical protein